MRKFFSRVWRVITFPFRMLWWLVTLPFRAIRAAWRFLTFDISDETAQAQQHSNMSFWDHVESLRMHLLRSLIVVALASIAAWVFIDPIIAFLAAPVGGPQNLQVIDPTESISVYLRIAVLVGFAIAIPYMAFEMWIFAAPGLRLKERLTALIGIPLAALFFYAGVYLTNQYMLPKAIEFLLKFGEFQANPTANLYYKLITRLLFWIGIFFEYPLVVYILTSIGFIKPSGLVRQWRIAVVIIAVIAAIVTPTTDMGSMALVMAPMTILYLFGILLSYLAYLARKRSLRNR